MIIEPKDVLFCFFFSQPTNQICIGFLTKGHLRWFSAVVSSSIDIFRTSKPKLSPESAWALVIPSASQAPASAMLSSTMLTVEQDLIQLLQKRL